MPLVDILCCFRSRETLQPEDTVDERTHLIPTTTTEDQPALTPNLVFIDPVQFRERLGTIVRAKEGRMVNVTPNYRSREQSLNRSSGLQRNRPSSRMSSAITSAHTTRSASASDSVSVQDDSDSLAKTKQANKKREKDIFKETHQRSLYQLQNKEDKTEDIYTDHLYDIRLDPTLCTQSYAFRRSDSDKGHNEAASGLNVSKEVNYILSKNRRSGSWVLTCVFTPFCNVWRLEFYQGV
ncbi:hypothetical protein GG344DRAFT_63161 [Lentinula edodes]|nr:hypothetical protein GG344DRAFT_63161 [Lentinula edodes]